MDPHCGSHPTTERNRSKKKETRLQTKPGLNSRVVAGSATITAVVYSSTDYSLTLTSICRGLASAFLANVMVSTPSFASAEMCSKSTVEGSLTERENVP